MNHVQPLDALLAGYAAGSLPAPVHVLVGAHLELTPHNRPFVRDLETLAAHELLHAIEPKPLTDRERRLAAIYEQEHEREFARPHTLSSAAVPASVRDADSRLPLSLRRFLGTTDISDMPWKTRLRGLKEWKIGEIDGCSASLYWIRAGQPIPSHTHKGSEVTLVLEGGFTDVLGHYVRGDIAVADEEVDHKPIADEDGDCICFAVTDAPLRPTGPLLRFLAPFLK